MIPLGDDNILSIDDDQSDFSTKASWKGTGEIENLVKTLQRGGIDEKAIESKKSFDLRAYGIDYEDDISKFYNLENVSRLIPDKHLALDLFIREDSQGGMMMRWAGLLRIVSCTCHFWSCSLNWIYQKTLWKRFVRSNRCIMLFFLVSFLMLLFFDVLGKVFFQIEGGVGYLSYFEIFLYRGLIGFSVIISFSLCGICCPCYRHYTIWNQFCSYCFLLVFGFISLGLMIAIPASVREVLIIQLLIFHFGGVNIFLRISLLLFQVVFLIVSSVLQFAIYNQERKITSKECFCVIFCSICLSFVIIQTMLAEHISSLVDFYLRGIIHKQQKRVEGEEKDCSNLMNSILPQTVVQQILQNNDNKSNNSSDQNSMIENLKSTFLEETSILFADAYQFTKFSSLLSPIDVVAMLNDYITKFDECTEMFGLSRIKLIGDCYEVASVPNTRGSPRQMALFSLEILKWIKKMKHGLKFRIGIHHGSCVSGVVGRGRITWDLFGKTVLIAEEYEQTGELMQIHCSLEFRKQYAHSSKFDDGKQQQNLKGRRYKFVERRDIVRIFGEKVRSFWLVGLKNENEELQDSDLLEFINYSSSKDELRDFINSNGSSGTKSPSSTTFRSRRRRNNRSCGSDMSNISSLTSLSELDGSSENLKRKRSSNLDLINIISKSREFREEVISIKEEEEEEDQKEEEKDQKEENDNSKESLISETTSVVSCVSEGANQRYDDDDDDRNRNDGNEEEEREDNSSNRVVISLDDDRTTRVIPIVHMIEDPFEVEDDEKEVVDEDEKIEEVEEKEEEEEDRTIQIFVEENSQSSFFK